MNIQQQLFPTLRLGVLRCLAATAILALASCTDGMDDALTPPDAGHQSPGEGISFEITIAPPSLSLAEEPFLGTPPAKEGPGVVSSSSLLAQTGGQRTTPNPSLVRRGTKITPAPTRAEEPSSSTPPVKEGAGEVSSSALTATACLLPEPSAPQTRASVPLTPEDGKYKAAWETGDAIGIFAVETDNDLAATGNPIHNVRLTRQEDGTWKPDPGTTLFWPRTDRSYYFAAYYPYTPDMDDAAHHFTVATNQDAADPATGKTGFDASVLLFGTSDGACSRGEGKPVTLTLRHATTMVVLSLDDRISALDLSRDFSVTLRGVNTGVSCSPSATALQPSAGSTSGDIVMQRVEQPETPAYRSRFTFRALIPSTSTANTKANFRIRNGGLLIDATAAYPPTAADAPAYRFTCPIPADALPRIPKGSVTYTGTDNTPATITISKDYRVGRYEVTATQFAEFLNAKKVEAPKGNDIECGGEKWGDLGHNRGLLSWNAAARRYEAREGREDKPVNHVTQLGAIAYAEWAGGRLPTLEEWQYACRAGSTTAYYFGDEASELGKYAVYLDNPSTSLVGSAPVGTKLPNAWGLYDMHGNVWEWTLTEAKEEWTEYYTSGGSWFSLADECRADFKMDWHEEKLSEEVGFRVFYTIPAQ